MDKLPGFLLAEVVSYLWVFCFVESANKRSWDASDYWTKRQWKIIKWGVLIYEALVFSVSLLICFICKNQSNQWFSYVFEKILWFSIGAKFITYFIALPIYARVKKRRLLESAASKVVQQFPDKPTGSLVVDCKKIFQSTGRPLNYDMGAIACACDNAKARLKEKKSN